MSNIDPAPQAPATDPKPTEGNPQPGSETDWQAKAEAQQKVNRDLEAKFNTLRDSQTTMTEAFAKALGIKPEDAPDVSVLAATVETLQQQFSQAQLDNTVLTIASENGITEAADIALLRSVKDEAAMRGIAARIAAKPPEAPTPGSVPGPRPDLSQGAQGTPATGDPAQEFATFLNGQMAR